MEGPVKFEGPVEFKGVVTGTAPVKDVCPASIRKSLNVANRAIAEKEIMMRMYRLLRRRAKDEGFLKIDRSVFSNTKPFPATDSAWKLQWENQIYMTDGSKVQVSSSTWIGSNGFKKKGEEAKR